jgi:hypothetical protein
VVLLAQMELRTQAVEVGVVAHKQVELEMAAQAALES